VTERRLETGPGFVRAKTCPGCGHTHCGESCTCNCDAEHAEHEAAIHKERIAALEARVKELRHALKGALHIATHPVIEAGGYLRSDDQADLITYGMVLRDMAPKETKPDGV
jgi:hypothetical protein